MRLTGLIAVAFIGVLGRVQAADTQRLAPAPESQWSEEQRELAQRFRGPDRIGNDLRTYLQYPTLVKNIMPFERYISSESTLTPRHRELLILRTAWLSRSQYVWAHHVPTARQAGVSAPEVARVGRESTSGWDPFESALLRAADQLHDSAFVDDDTWNTLASRYDTPHMMDAVFTVAEFSMVGDMLNSVGVPLEKGFKEALPSSSSRHVARNEERLIGKAPRITPLDPSEWTPEVRQWLERNSSGRQIAAVYRTYARHLPMDKPRTLVSEHIRQTTSLSPKFRELLIMRIGYLCRSEYEWAAHAPAGRRAGLTETEYQRVIHGPDQTGRTVDQMLLHAVDELYRDDVISDSTWKDLSANFDTRQLLDILVTVGGYRGVSMALNSFGVQLEPNAVRFPAPNVQ
jgi:4-carboxymuconolactone decarboxylase